MICIHIGFFSQFLSVILQLRLRSADLRLGMFPDGQLAAGESMDVSAGGASVDRCLGEIRGGCGGDVTRNDGSLREQGICDMLHSCVFVYFYSCIWYTYIYIYILYVDIWYIYMIIYIYISMHTYNTRIVQPFLKGYMYTYCWLGTPLEGHMNEMAFWQ